MSSETKKPALFTEREVEIMAVAWTCFDGEPKLNYSKLANILGMSNDRSASNAWAKIKKKLASQAAEMSGDATAENNNGDAGTPVKTPKAPKTPASGKKRGKKTAEDADDGDDGEATPTKKSVAKKGRKTVAKKVKKEESEEDAAVDGEPMEDE